MLGAQEPQGLFALQVLLGLPQGAQQLALAPIRLVES
jgi:hypothetical protein